MTDCLFDAVEKKLETYFKSDENFEDTTNYPEDLSKLANYIYEKDFRAYYCEKSYYIGVIENFTALHKYIIKHFGNCFDQHSNVSLYKSDIAQILQTCNTVLEKPSKAILLLPSKRYDEAYFKKVKEAIQFFTLVLDSVDFNKYEVVYQGSY